MCEKETKSHGVETQREDHVRTQRRDFRAATSQGEEALRRNQPCRHLDPEPLASRTRENK